MLSINMSDVMNVINSIRTYLIAIGAIIIAAILIQLLVSRMKKPGRRLIRGSALSRRSQASASA
jgi:beta-glucosidase